MVQYILNFRCDNMMKFITKLNIYYVNIENDVMLY